MYSVVKYCWFFLILVAQDLKSKELVLVAGLAKPPYVIPEQDTGFEVDLMRDVLASLGHNISMLYVPYGRTYETMKKVKADIGLTLSESHGVKSEILSIPYVTYQNVAVSLLDNSIKLDKMSELQTHTVVAFQNAQKVLGQVFAQATEISPLYIELPEQRKQVELLLSHKVDVVVMDINIFNYFAKSISGSSQADKVQVHRLFTPNHYSAVIQDPVLRASFNQAFSKYILTAEYDKLLAKYDMVYATQPE